MIREETKLYKRIQAQRTRQRRRDAGVCIVCGEQPAGTNRDGTASTRCDPCRAQCARPRTPRPAARRRLEVIKIDDELVLATWLDSKEFDAFCEEVFDVCSGRVTIGDIRRSLGDRCIDHWLSDALDALVGKRLLDELTWLIPTRWQRRQEDRNA